MHVPDMHTCSERSDAKPQQDGTDHQHSIRTVTWHASRALTNDAVRVADDNMLTSGSIAHRPHIAFMGEKRRT